MKLNPDEETVKYIHIMLKNNDGYCPCISIRNEDTKCPCKKFREEEECCCDLYVEE